MLAPGTVLSGLLDDLEKRRIMTFPTSAQLRDTVADPGIAMDPEDEAFAFIENSDGRLFQSTQGSPEYRIPVFPDLTLGRPCIQKRKRRVEDRCSRRMSMATVVNAHSKVIEIVG